MNSVSAWRRHIHDEDMADAPRGAQAGLPMTSPRASARRCAGCPSSAARPCRRGSARRPCAAAASLCGASTISILARCRCRACAATAVIFAAGPTRIGTMMPGLGRLDAPRSEVSSQGCTTTVVDGRHVLRRARSGARIWRAAPASVAQVDDSCCAHSPWTATPVAFDGVLRRWQFADRLRRARASRLEQLATRSSRSAALRPSSSAGAPDTSPEHVKRLARSLGVRRQQRGNGRERRFLVDQQHEELLAHQRLELRQRQRGRSVVRAAIRRIASKPRSSTSRAPCRHRAAPRTSASRSPPLPICALAARRYALRTSSRCSGLFAGLARRARWRRIDAERGLQQRASRRSTGTSARTAFSVASRQRIERVDDLLRHLSPAAQETDCRRRPACARRAPAPPRRRPRP